jgi:hypothetical protein
MRRQQASPGLGFNHKPAAESKSIFTVVSDHFGECVLPSIIVMKNEFKKA